MKIRYNTFDIVCVVTELQKLVGMRVNNVYDIDNKTYLIRLQRNEEKSVLLFESGNRIHLTNFEWPKNVAPSGFSMKLRKHLKNKRLEKLSQIGTDRIIDMQFGSGEAGYHVILELYDRGNIVLADYEMIILNVLRPHTEGDKVRFAVREKYPENRARETAGLTQEVIISILEKGKIGDQVKKVLISNLDYGPALIEHVLLKQGITNATKIGKNFNLNTDSHKIFIAICEADSIFQKAKNECFKGFIIQKKEERAITETNKDSEFYSNQEFHPMLFEQHSAMPYKEFGTFNLAVDEFFSSLESQKLELKAVQQEREALKKLENVKKDHTQRLVALEKVQEVDKQKAELITRNQELVDKAILSVQMLLANQLSWEDIEDVVKDASAKGDPIAGSIRNLKLEMNHISLFLDDPYAEFPSSDVSDSEANDNIPSMLVDVDLALTAFANARRYYDQKRTAAKKQQKTIESQTKALKSAERKTQQTLKDMQTITNINKARKVYWFEKFFWFISSENYLVIAGRDQQQNELIVKRYLKATDVYVHADIHGASSVLIKNPSGQPVPPKTLNDAGTMAICYSVAWEAKVITNAYWVWGDQVSKTAPTGEYLSTGSFMVRGKKNFLPPSHLILGFSFLFKLEDGCIEKHAGERKVLTQVEEDALNQVADEVSKEEVELDVLDESDEDELKKEKENMFNAQTDLEVTVAVADISEVKSESSSDSEEKSNFPDTQIKIQHFEGTKRNILIEPTIREEPKNEPGIFYLGDNKPVILKQNNSRSRTSSHSSSKTEKDQPKREAEQSNRQQQSKRGQRSKLKKIKEKYKDQDEEERELRMNILQSSGTGKETKKSKKGKETHTKPAKKPQPAPRLAEPKESNDVNDDDEPTVQAEVDMIDSLTGIPFADDELLFAVPVVAPYNTLSNYKFKVKLTPGTARRGKAARTALTMFLKDRGITQREKDLLKAVKDEQLARNLPGKVKLSAPKMQALRR
ncbi:ribosome quality control complex subunit NEMF homolog [Cylas formicarius]|nr:ribosome quality control complex subunit NEMF homolog [Cylas formicarius]